MTVRTHLKIFFAPDRSKFGVFLAFLAIHIMATIFYDIRVFGLLLGLPSIPFFYLIVFPILWVVNHWRLDLLLNQWLTQNDLPISAIGIPLFTIIYPTIQLFYYYCLACVIIYLARRLAKNRFLVL